MAVFSIRKGDFRNVRKLGVRVSGAYAGTVTEEGPLVSDSFVLFNRHFVRKEARVTANELSDQRNGRRGPFGQQEARDRLAWARDEAVYEGELLGYVETVPGLRVKTEFVAGVRYRSKKKGKWHYVWVDAHRLRLMMELFKSPLRYFCASWQQPVVLKRGQRTVGCLMPASPCRLDIEVAR